jgi:hypothetical protein
MGPSSEIGEISDHPSCGGESDDTVHRAQASLLPPITTPKLDQQNDLVNGSPILEDSGIENGRCSSEGVVDHRMRAGT